ncbi:Dihydrolipoyl dehydrogenase [uncultured archaeon]|nr:Dihydrolipoyl dehydrogenase [uncultured archaeon]
MKTYDAISLGGGPGGYMTALRVAQNGGSAAVVEAEGVGGECTNHGCIPTKTLQAAAHIKKDLDKKSRRFGITAEATVDYRALIKRKNQVVATLATGTENLLRTYGVDIIRGKGVPVSPTQVRVEGEKPAEITAKNIIIAWGAHSIFPPGFAPDGTFIHDSRSLLANETQPQKLAIIGGGVIGCEFASILNSLGTNTTIIESLPTILPTLDPDISKEATRQMTRDGIRILTSTKAESINTKSRTITIETPAGKETLQADAVLVAVGRRPTINEEPLKKIGVKYDPKKGIPTDENQQTNIKGIYAVGDVTGGPQYAHAAYHQADTAAAHILKKTQHTTSPLPSAIFTLPEIGTVGPTEDEAHKKGDITVGRSEYAILGKAHAMAEREGFVKVIADAKTKRIIAVHMIGAQATDLIAEAALAIKLNATLADVAGTIHAHPTLAEALEEACANAIKQGRHTIRQN